MIESLFFFLLVVGVVCCLLLVLCCLLLGVCFCCCLSWLFVAATIRSFLSFLICKRMYTYSQSYFVADRGNDFTSLKL